MLTPMNLQMHRMSAVALGFQLRVGSDMESEQQRSARSEHAVEMVEDTTDLVVGDVNQRVPRDQPGHGEVRKVEVRHEADLESRAA
ncbi:hypothetical protein [Nocardia heshunensis]